MNKNSEENSSATADPDIEVSKVKGSASLSNKKKVVEKKNDPSTSQATKAGKASEKPLNSTNASSALQED